MQITDNCYGCMACVNICPKDAISISNDKMGFFIPVVNEDQCVHCNKCVKTCPANHDYSNMIPINAISAFNKSKEVVQKSSSGGMFATIGECVLSNGGKVYSAVYDYDEKMLKYDSTDNYPLNAFYKSKYVESFVGSTYKKIKDDLTSGQMIYFSGTPCHVAGLLSYLGKEYDNLITTDFACGGVPSNKMLKNYLCVLEKKYKAKVSNLDFRAKLYGWHIHSMKITFSNGKEYRRIVNKEPYLHSFIFSNITRERCLSCNFVDKHQADITLADFWKYKSFDNIDNNNDDGLSLLLVNTRKGENILEKIKEDICYVEIDPISANYNAKERITTDQKIEKLHSNYSYLEDHSIIALYRKNTSISYRLKSDILLLKKYIRRQLTK